jgi:hypothetical protein
MISEGWVWWWWWQEVLESSVDVEGIARTSREWAAMISFLLRRNPLEYVSDLPHLVISLIKVCPLLQPLMILESILGI